MQEHDGAMGWSAVCDCGICWSYLLTPLQITINSLFSIKTPGHILSDSSETTLCIRCIRTCYQTICYHIHFIGDRIVLASTDYDWEQAEERVVVECPECNNYQVKLDGMCI